MFSISVASFLLLLLYTMSINWYTREETQTSSPPPVSPVTSLISITYSSTPDLHLRENEYSSDDRKTLDDICTTIAADKAHFPQTQGFILRGTAIDNPSRILLLLPWTDQPPPSLPSLSIPNTSISTTHVALTPPPHWMNGRSQPIEFHSWTLPGDHSSPAKRPIFNTAFDSLDEFESSYDGGRDAHDGPGDLKYFARGWNLQEGKVLGSTHHVLMQFASEAAEMRFKDPERQNHWPEVPQDLYERCFVKPVMDMQKAGMKQQRVDGVFKAWFPPKE